MLKNAGHLSALAGVAIGQYTDCGPERNEPQVWSYLPVLRDHLDRWGVPILGGLPLGHGRDPHSVPLGTAATFDADSGRLQVGSAMQ